MKLILKYDQQGYYIPGEDKVIRDDEEIPDGYTDIPLPIPNWLPKFNLELEIWEETATEEEKAPIENPEITDVSYLKQQNGFLTKELAKTQKMNLILANQLGDILLLMAEQSAESPPEDPLPEDPTNVQDIDREGERL